MTISNTVLNLNVRQLLFKRQTTPVAEVYVGPSGELVFDTGLKGLRVHDGVTAGGTRVPTLQDANNFSNTWSVYWSNVYVQAGLEPVYQSIAGAISYAGNIEQGVNAITGNLTPALARLEAVWQSLGNNTSFLDLVTTGFANINNSLSNEVNRAVTAENYLEALISTETNVRIANVTSINSQFANVIVSINDEISTRAAADAVFTTNIAQLNVGLTNEIAAREAADLLLANDISNEANARIAADTTEANLRANADTLLTNTITTEIANRQANISAEANTRIAEDTSLQANIIIERTERLANVVALYANVADERTRAITSENAIDANLQAEITARIAGNVTLSNLLVAETLRATTKEAQIDANVTAANIARILADAVIDANVILVNTNMLANVAIERQARLDLGNLLNANIAVVVSNFANGLILANANLTTEITRAVAAETVLQTNIYNEANARISGNTVLLTLLNAETTNRQANIAIVNATISSESANRIANVTNLQTQINNILNNTSPGALDSLAELVLAFQAADANLLVTINTLSTGANSALSLETTRATQAETSLQNNINFESNLRAAAINLVYSTIASNSAAQTAAITAETTARAAAIVSLQSNIVAEQTARILSDVLIQANLATEITARITAVSNEANTRSAAIASLTANIVAIESREDNIVNGAFTVDLNNTGQLNVPGHVIPKNNLNQDLGSPTQRWRDLYISASTINMGTGNISIDPVAGLQIQNAGVPVPVTGNIRFPDGTAQTTAFLPVFITNEANARTAADNSLQSNITTVDTARITGNTVVSAIITQEISDRAAADTSLQANITAVNTASTTGNTIVSARITTEIADRISADANLQANINTVNAASISGNTIVSARITQEILDRISADANLQANINTVNAASISGNTIVSARITQEITDRSNADVLLQANITTLSNAITTANTVSNTLMLRAVSDEANLRIAADTSLQSNIVAALNSANASIITANTIITTRLNTEITDRIANVASAEANIIVERTRALEAEANIAANVANLTVQVVTGLKPSLLNSSFFANLTTSGELQTPGNVYSVASNGSNLGTSVYPWNAVYAKNAGIFLGNAGIRLTEGGNLTVATAVQSTGVGTQFNEIEWSNTLSQIVFRVYENTEMYALMTKFVGGEIIEAVTPFTRTIRVTGIPSYPTTPSGVDGSSVAYYNFTVPVNEVRPGGLVPATLVTYQYIISCRLVVQPRTSIGSLTNGSITADISTGGNLLLPGNVIPKSTNLYTLGTATRIWQDIYLDGTARFNNVTMTVNTAGVRVTNISNTSLPYFGNIVFPDNTIQTTAFLTSYITNEANTRANAVANLQSQLNFIKTNTDPAALDSLTELLANFNATSSNVASVANTAVFAEFLRANTVETAITANLNSEIVRAIAAETSLQANIVTANITLANIIANVTANLQSQINYINQNTDVSSIDSLTEIVTHFGNVTANNFNTLADGINTEANIRANADAALLANITTESATRSNAITAITANITTLFTLIAAPVVANLTNGNNSVRLGSTDALTITVANTVLTGNLVSTSSNNDIGHPSRRWHDIYLTGNLNVTSNISGTPGAVIGSTIYFDDVGITSDRNGAVGVLSEEFGLSSTPATVLDAQWVGNVISLADFVTPSNAHIAKNNTIKNIMSNLVGGEQLIVTFPFTTTLTILTKPVQGFGDVWTFTVNETRPSGAFSIGIINYTYQFLNRFRFLQSSRSTVRSLTNYGRTLLLSETGNVVMPTNGNIVFNDNTVQQTAFRYEFITSLQSNITSNISSNVIIANTAIIASLTATNVTATNITFTGNVTGSGAALTGFANVARTGVYSDLTERPTLANIATTGNYSDISGTPILANVATTGAYADLTGRPANVSLFNNDSDYANVTFVATQIAAFNSTISTNVITANTATITSLTATNITGLNDATFNNLIVTSGTITSLTVATQNANVFVANTANIASFRATNVTITNGAFASNLVVSAYASFQNSFSNNLFAITASVDSLNVVSSLTINTFATENVSANVLTANTASVIALTATNAVISSNVSIGGNISVVGTSTLTGYTAATGTVGNLNANVFVANSVSSTEGTINQLTSINAAITNTATISGTANIAIAILEITTANVITANTLTVSGNINGSGNNLSGFANVARTGSYTDLINTPATNYEPKFDIRTADFTANVGRRYGIDTRVGTIISTLPNSGLTAGDAIFFIDAGGDFTANNFTIARNGNTINGVGSNFVANTNGDSVGVFWNGTGWRTYQ